VKIVVIHNELVQAAEFHHKMGSRAAVQHVHSDEICMYCVSITNDQQAVM